MLQPPPRPPLREILPFSAWSQLEPGKPALCPTLQIPPQDLSPLASLTSPGLESSNPLLTHPGSTQFVLNSKIISLTILKGTFPLQLLQHIAYIPVLYAPSLKLSQGFSGGTNVQESACQCRTHRRHGIDPWVGEIACRRKWQPNPSILAWKSPWTGEPVFLPAVGTSPSPYLSSCPPTRNHQFQNILLLLFLLYPLLARKVVYTTIFFFVISTTRKQYKSIKTSFLYPLHVPSRKFCIQKQSVTLCHFVGYCAVIQQHSKEQPKHSLQEMETSHMSVRASKFRTQTKRNRNAHFFGMETLIYLTSKTDHPPKCPSIKK